MAIPLLVGPEVNQDRRSTRPPPRPPLFLLPPPPQARHPCTSFPTQVPVFDRRRIQMSTLSPDHRHHHREDLMRTSQVNMAVAQPTKTKSASKASHNANSKQKSQMHRRSRTGSCWFPQNHSLHSWCLLDADRCCPLQMTVLSTSSFVAWAWLVFFIVLC